MISAIDTNVLLDILIPNTKYVGQSLESVSKAGEEGSLIISEIVYAELSSQFLKEESLKRFLSEATIQLVTSDELSLWEAGCAWREYIRRRHKEVACPACGKSVPFSCPHCGRPIYPRQHLISDFLIGAHAKVFADRLITRDRGFYRRYFKGLKIADPTRMRIHR